MGKPDTLTVPGPRWYDEVMADDEIAEDKINDLAERRARERARRLEIVTAEHERICAIMGWPEDA